MAAAMTHLGNVVDGCVGDLLARVHLSGPLPAAQGGEYCLEAGGGRRRRLLGIGQGRPKDQANAQTLSVRE